MSYLELLKLVAPEALVVFTALTVLTIALTNKSSRATELCSTTALLGLTGAMVAVLTLPYSATLFGGMLVVSPLTSLFKAACMILAAFTIVLLQSEHSLQNRGEFAAILLLATVGLMLLIGSEELLMIFIGLELTGLSLYIMAAFDKSDVRSAEAGLKYFLFGSTASAFTLFGISIVYGMTGSTALSAIAQKLATLEHVQPFLMAGIVMTLVGFAFKIAAAPFHLWAPDTYQGAPISSAAFIASGSKVASFVVLGKIVVTGFGPIHGNAGWHAMTHGVAPVIAVLAALSILLGNFAALAQKNVRRLLAYSAVAHAGYTLLGLVKGNGDGFSAALFYITIYAVTLIGAFGVVGLVRRETGGDELKDFAGLAKRSPWLATCMAIFLLSLAGLPPLVGFFGKFYLFSATLGAWSVTQAGVGASNSGELLWLVALALFGSLVSLYYYLVVVKVMFVDAPSQTSERAIDSSVLHRATVTVLAGLVLFLGIMPGFVADRIIAALR